MGTSASKRLAEIRESDFVRAISGAPLRQSRTACLGVPSSLTALRTSASADNFASVWQQRQPIANNGSQNDVLNDGARLNQETLSADARIADQRSLQEVGGNKIDNVLQRVSNGFHASQPETKTEACTNGGSTVKPQTDGNHKPPDNDENRTNDEYAHRYAALAETFREAEKIFDHDGFGSQKLTQAFEILEAFTGIPLSDPLRARWVEKLLCLGLVQTWLKWWPEIWKENFVDGETHRPEMLVWGTNFTYWLRILWNSSNLNTRTCDEFVEKDGFKHVVEKLTSKSFDAELMRTQRRKRYFVSGLLSICHNCLKSNKDASIAFRNAGGVGMLERFVHSSCTTVKTKTLFCLSLAIDEKQTPSSTLVSSSSIKFLLHILGDALANPRHEVSAAHFLLIDILQALNHVAAASDDNKTRLAKCGALQILSRVILESQCNDELLLAIQGIWSLAFTDEVKLKIKDDAQVMDSLANLKAHSNASISRSADGALWTVAHAVTRMKRKAAKTSTTTLRSVDVLGLPANVTSLTSISNGRSRCSIDSTASISELSAANSSGSTGRHLMISYEWTSQPVALKLREGLHYAGYCTWVDVDDMSGSILEAVARAIEEAACVLVLVSENYKKSPACRAEAEYTYSLRKPILPVCTQKGYAADGWLGVFLGARYHVDCFSQRQAYDALPKIAKELVDRKIQTTGAIPRAARASPGCKTQ